MKANELRIGNWIMESDGRIEPVWEIEAILVDNEMSVNDCPVSTIHPIPLTEEWLLRFAFYFIHGAYMTSGDMYLTYSSLNGWFINGNEKIEIEYVHQLQNLYFALTGEELTLTTQTPTNTL